MEKNFKRVSSAPRTELIKRTGMSHTAIAEVLGVSDSSIGKCVSIGTMPAIYSLAVEALYKRKVNPDEETVIVTSLSGDRVMDSRAVSSPGRMDLNGQTYLLIPTKKG